MTTPDLSDKYPHVDFLNLQFTNFGKKGFFSGKIETAICPDDNSKVKQILNEEGDGKILIVDGQGSTRVALMGDMIAESAEKNNWQAVIINGCVRDVEALSNFKIGIFALGLYFRDGCDVILTSQMSFDLKFFKFLPSNRISR